jgi:hypothetical protein
MSEVTVTVRIWAAGDRVKRCELRTRISADSGTGYCNDLTALARVAAG